MCVKGLGVIRPRVCECVRGHALNHENHVEGCEQLCVLRVYGYSEGV